MRPFIFPLQDIGPPERDRPIVTGDVVGGFGWRRSELRPPAAHGSVVKISYLVTKTFMVLKKRKTTLDCFFLSSLT